MRRKFLKVALSVDDYRALGEQADAEGLTLAAYVRAQLAREREALTTQAALARVESALAAVVPPTPAPSVDTEPLLIEMFMQVRELLAANNAQAVARIAQHVNALYPARKKI